MGIGCWAGTGAGVSAGAGAGAGLGLGLGFLRLEPAFLKLVGFCDCKLISIWLGWVGFESDGLGGSVGAGGGRSFATGTRFSEVGFCD